MIVKYYLKENLLQRNAANLSFNLNEISDSIYIYRNNDERKVNGKSLIGILSGHFL
jgi:phosphotransferase system HPr-like phosphotransfer protein